MSFSCIWLLLGEQRADVLGLKVCARAWAQRHCDVWIFQRAFLHPLLPSRPSSSFIPVRLVLPLSFIKAKPLSFSRPGSILLSDKKPDSLMTTLYPIVQSAKITIPYLYLYWGKPFSASKQSGRECFPCWTCPVLPRLWYCCGLPSRRARLPVIGLPFSSHHLSALWIQLQGPKRTTTLQLKRLICPRPSLPPPSPPQLAMSSLALICASVLLFLWIFLSLAFSSCLL